MANAEESALVDYMQRVSKETWAETNPRLQKYIKEEMERFNSKSRESPAKSSLSSTRLGFAHHGSYSKCDLAGTNEIMRGDFLTLSSD